LKLFSLPLHWVDEEIEVYLGQVVGGGTI